MQRGLRAVAKAVAITATLIGALWFVLAVRSPLHQYPGNRGALTGQAREMLLPPSERRQQIIEPPLLIPVFGVQPDQLLDTFSEARASGARAHDAIDIVAPRGTAVIAAAAGRVERLFLSKEGGNTVYVRSNDGRRIYYYAHLDSYASELIEGRPLHQGAPIGFVGSTGNADPLAPHLHFAIWMTTPERKWWEDRIALNPFDLLKPR